MITDFLMELHNCTDCSDDTREAVALLKFAKQGFLDVYGYSASRRGQSDPYFVGSESSESDEEMVKLIQHFRHVDSGGYLEVAGSTGWGNPKYTQCAVWLISPTEVLAMDYMKAREIQLARPMGVGIRFHLRKQYIAINAWPIA